jgi:hypothetical protein
MATIRTFDDLSVDDPIILLKPEAKRPGGQVGLVTRDPGIASDQIEGVQEVGFEPPSVPNACDLEAMLDNSVKLSRSPARKPVGENKLPPLIDGIIVLRFSRIETRPVRFTKLSELLGRDRPFLGDAALGLGQLGLELCEEPRAFFRGEGTGSRTTAPRTGWRGLVSPCLASTHRSTA